MNPLLMGGMSILGGLMGGGPSMPAGQRNLLRLQHRAGREMQEFAHTAPLSDPGERAALASQRGLMGQQQRSMMGGLFSNLGANGSPAPMDMMSNLASNFSGQQSALTAQALQEALRRRQQALMQSAQIAAGAVPASQMTQQGTDFGSIFGQLGQQMAYRDAMRQGPQLQQGTPGIVNVGGGWNTTYHPTTPATMAERGGPFGLFQR
jgi:hypothetical protein